VILDYAQHMACLKMGGQEFADTMPLLKGFFAAAQETNKRLMRLGLNFEEMAQVGRQEQLDVPRQ
jgi:hypothetical protein